MVFVCHRVCEGGGGSRRREVLVVITYSGGKEYGSVFKKTYLLTKLFVRNVDSFVFIHTLTGIMLIK